MNWLALSPAWVGAIWATLAATALWLYLHHRRPQHRRVSTLRFWASVQPISQPRRRKLREPWAFLAQILFLLFLVLALANPRWGPVSEGRSVALVIDASIWSQVQPSGERAWIDLARAEALKVLDALPNGDRVLLLRAEADAPPVLSFTTDRAALRRAIQTVQPSSVAADIPRALETGRAALGEARRGLLVYVGAGLINADEEQSFDEFRAQLEAPEASANVPQFLMREVGDFAGVKNRGITRISLRRDAVQPDRWHLLTQIKNYGNEKADAVLSFSVNGQPIGQRKLTLSAHALSNAEEEFNWNQGGMLQAEISPADSMRADDRASVNVPSFRTIDVAVFASRASPFASSLLGVLSSNPYVQARIVPPEPSASVQPDVAIYQGQQMPAQPGFNSIWFLSGPPVAGSKPVRIRGWNLQHPVTRWVRTRDVSVRNPATIKMEPGDSVLAYAETDPPLPLIVAREQGGHRILIVGFNPQDSNFPLQSAFPLMMAGSVEWMTHSVDEVAESLSTGEVDIPGPATKIIAPSGKEVPFARKGANLHLLALETGTYRIVEPNGESKIAINPPSLPAQRVQLTPAETASVEREPLPPPTWDMWRWLAIAAMLALWLEWALFYMARERQRATEVQEVSAGQPKQNFEDELELGEESAARNTNLVDR
jgi:Ca-activated chloride channel homolog